MGPAGERGVDLRGGDLVVGTSAGSVVGAQVAARSIPRRATPPSSRRPTGRSGPPRPITGVEAPLRAGSRVTLVSPDAAALAAIGRDVLDPARRAPAARAGREQAAAVADGIAATWGA